MRSIAICFGIVGLLFLSGCVQQEETPGSYVDVTPQEVRTLIENNPDMVIIDVSPFYSQGHIPGAVHYYLGDGSLEAAIPSLNRDGMYLVYCHTDSVSIQAAQRLVDEGFTHVYRLEGNFGAWVDAGYDVET